MSLYKGKISEEFNIKYNYDGPLGLEAKDDGLVFRVWAPEADNVWLVVYESGDISDTTSKTKVPMKYEGKGVFKANLSTCFLGCFYTYLVKRNNDMTEACDPYATAVGINGERAAIVDMKKTNPVGWSEDNNPNRMLSAEESIIYETHVRDLTISDTAKVKHRGLFKGVTETAADDSEIGLNYISSLGVTHVQFLPIYDFGSVDEKKPSFNWGYDPKNYFAVEGSYSTNPYDPSARITELKEMIMACHKKGLSVVMDVVLNHVFDAKDFCFNKIVPGYFSRIDENGIYSNGSFCGNDNASERYMVSRFIVDNILYWAKEYHIDGFRFDLVGLIDIDTINQVVATVKAYRSDIIFHGEGWDMPTVLTEAKPLATQMNSVYTKNFAYFDDVIRNLLRGDNFHPEEKGYCNGGKGMKNLLKSCIIGKRYWSDDSNQLINYVSCHDDYTLFDKFKTASKELSDDILMKQCMLAAGICFISKGIPLFLNGEEFGRSKVNEDGTINSNSYKSSDFVNAIDWNLLKEEKRQEMINYYKKLIAFKKAAVNIQYQRFKDGINDESLMVLGRLDEKQIIIIMNPEDKEVCYDLPEHGYTTVLSSSSMTRPTYETQVIVPPVTFLILKKKI